MVGKIIAVSDLVIKVLLNDDAKVIIKDILIANCHDREYKFEVVEISGFTAKAIALDSVLYLKKGIPLYKKTGVLDIEYSDQILGKVFDSYGNIIYDEVIAEAVHDYYLHDSNMKKASYEIIKILKEKLR